MRRPREDWLKKSIDDSKQKEDLERKQYLQNQLTTRRNVAHNL